MKNMDAERFTQTLLTILDKDVDSEVKLAALNALGTFVTPPLVENVGAGDHRPVSLSFAHPVTVSDRGRAAQ